MIHTLLLLFLSLQILTPPVFAETATSNQTESIERYAVTNPKAQRALEEARIRRVRAILAGCENDDKKCPALDDKASPDSKGSAKAEK